VVQVIPRLALNRSWGVNSLYEGEARSMFAVDDSLQRRHIIDQLKVPKR